MERLWDATAVVAGLAFVAQITTAVSISSSPASKVFTNSVGIKMVRIEPGAFTMGETNPVPASLAGPSYSELGDWDERPAHRIRITQPYYISETPITIEQYRQFKKEYKGLDLFEPYVSGVSWNEATEFCRWLSRKEGKVYRLPTEAEWEYAARAGAGTLFWSGNEPPKEGAVHPWGLKDMAAGVPEWCYDWHDRYPDEDQTDPVGPAAGIARVVRDGSLEMREFEAKDDRSRSLGFKPSEYKDITPYFRRSANRASMLPDVPSPETTGPATRYTHFIGFRVVQAALPATPPLAAAKAFPLDFVTQSTVGLDQGPEPTEPYFKARPILPIPPENDQGGGIEAVGLHPGIMAHLHSAGFTMTPNGDLLQISFASSTRKTEYEPNTTFVVTRLRHGAQQWDMPDLFYDLADSNEQSALLWNDNGKIWFFGGGRFFGDVRFKFATSIDSGASWTDLELPYIAAQKDYVEAQPINSAFRGPGGAIYFGSDAKGGSSMLWASHDDGKTWVDTGGRTAGRHTNFVMLKDGRILAMGGKNTNIEGYMPRTCSSDGGKTWSKSVKTPFPAMGGNNRPTILRLKSGRLFFASDFQQIMQRNQPPAEVKERGALVALSEDEGETWRVKKLHFALPHETRQIPKIKRNWEGGDHDHGTIGYSAAVQAPNSVIHLMTSMNHPSMHFEMNEAWILSDETGEVNHRVEGAQAPVRQYSEKHPDGKVKVTWSGRPGANGSFVRHGAETWYYPDGMKNYEATYQDGKKVGKEALWNPAGRLKWSWEHRADGSSRWTHFWPNGQKRIESNWRDFKAEGVATHWDRHGKVVRRFTFKGGAIVD